MSFFDTSNRIRNIFDEIKNISEEIKQEFPIYEKNISRIFSSKKYNKLFAIWTSENKKVYGCGNNNQGLLGLGNNKNINHIIPIGENQFDSNKIRKFILGDCCIFALTKSNVYSWGWNYWGQLANGELGEIDSYNPIEKNVFLENITDIACGRCHYLALSTEGKVYSWGANFEGQIGIGIHEQKNIISKPYLIGLPDKIRYIHCFSNSSFALSEDGKLYFWGENHWGDFDDLDTDLIFNPVEIKCLPKIIAIVGTSDWIFALTENQKVLRGFDHNSFEELPLLTHISNITFDPKHYLVSQECDRDLNPLKVYVFDGNVSEKYDKDFVRYFDREYGITYKTIKNVGKSIFIEVTDKKFGYKRIENFSNQQNEYREEQSSIEYSSDESSSGSYGEDDSDE